MSDLTFEQLESLIDRAKRAGVSEFKAKGVHIKFAAEAVTDKTDKRPVPDVKAEDIFKPSSPLDDLTPEEILYYATPHFDTIQAEKEARKQAIKEGTYGQNS